MLWEETPQGEVTLGCQTIPWRKESTTLLSERGQAELEAAFRQLSLQFKLSGVPMNLVLNGDFCVTRAVSGSTERVKHELAQLERRSSLYLRLGHGPKTPGGSIRQIDARHQHALLTVVHQRTLEILVETANRADWKLNIVEPSLVALCRFVGQTGGDHEGPTLLVNLSKGTAEVGISHRGELLLDYRPAGLAAGEDTAAVVAQHMSRIERYCNRYVSFAGGNLQKIYLSGHADLVEAAKKGFEERTEVPVEILTREVIDRTWHSQGNPAGSAEIAALGSCLRGREGDEATGPNLLQKMRTVSTKPLGALLLKAAWPIAAAVLLAMGAWTVVGWEAAHVHKLEDELEQLEEPFRQARLLKGDVLRLRGQLDHYQKLEGSLDEPGWNNLSQQIAQCMPEGVWLNDLVADDAGGLMLLGTSYSEDGVFELAGWLENLPELCEVNIRSTEQTSFPKRPRRAISGALPDRRGFKGGKP